MKGRECLEFSRRMQLCVASTSLQYKYIVCMIVVQCDNMFLFDYRPSFTTVVKSDLIYLMHFEKSRA